MRAPEGDSTELEFPHDFLKGEDMFGLVYGGQWRQIFDRRRALSTPVNDDALTSKPRG